MRKNISKFILDHQDIEKEVRKEVDEAIAQAKVRWCNFLSSKLRNLEQLCNQHR